MKITKENDIWTELESKCSEKMFEAVNSLRENLDSKYGKDKVQYVLEYGGIDKEGTEVLSVMLAGAVISFGEIRVTKDGMVIM